MVKEKSWVLKEKEEEEIPKKVIVKEYEQENPPFNPRKEKGNEDIPPKKWNKMRAEHPQLATLYSDLKYQILLDTNCRDTSLKRGYELAIDNIRRSIRGYEIKHNITRNDHQRWSE